jgi:hypothetical protein
MQKSILVLYGGNSNEREVSLRSGANVAKQLQANGHHVLLRDTAEPGFDLSQLVHEVDVVLPMLHGAGGEDGVLQREFDRLGVPYFGSDAEACVLTFNKVATRGVNRGPGNYRAGTRRAAVAGHTYSAPTRRGVRLREQIQRSQPGNYPATSTADASTKQSSEAGAASTPSDRLPAFESDGHHHSGRRRNVCARNQYAARYDRTKSGA